MRTQLARPVSGHVFRVERQRGPVWYMKYRLPDGRQVQKKLGPAWTRRGRPAEGYFTKTTAQDALDGLLQEIKRGQHPGVVRTGITFAAAADEWLRYQEHDRGRKPATVAVYRALIKARMLTVFGDMAVESITAPMVESWLAGLDGAPATRTKAFVALNGIMRRARKVYGLPFNPVADVEKPPAPTPSGDIQVFSPDEIAALVDAAASEQDAAIYLTAAYTGLRRGELIALRWRDVDFDADTVRVRASYSESGLTTPKSGKVRSVPLSPDVASALTRLRDRGRWTGDDDLVFPGRSGGFLDGRALRRRYQDALDRAGLRRLRFHDLRHTFGTRVIGVADIRRVQEWMGHADIKTTMRYLHYAPRKDDAALVAQAFEA
ncbi:MAG: tyrosine-type recombinase/integrase [Thermoleophilaceae bacterium]